MGDDNLRFSDFLPYKSTSRLCSSEISMMEPQSSITLSSHGVVTLSINQGIQCKGKVLNVLESLYQSRSDRSHIVDHVSVVNGHTEVWRHGISIRRQNDKRTTLLYDPVLNTCFFFQEQSREKRLLQVNQDIAVDMFILCLDDQGSAVDVDLSSQIPQHQLHYKNINLFDYQLVKGGNFIAVFGNGYEYGHKRTHVDYSEGFVVDLVPYSKDRFLEPVLHFSVDAYKHAIDLNTRFIEPVFYAVKSTGKLFCYLDFKERSLAYVVEFKMNQPDSDCVVYTINDDAGKKINFFEHCISNQFVYASEDEVTILSLHNKFVRILNKFSIKMTHEIPKKNSFSLYNQFGTMLLCMQYPSLVLRIFDLNSGVLCLGIQQGIVIERITLNWNMYEFFCTSFEDGKLTLDVYDIGIMDISLKNLSKLALLKCYPESELQKMPMPLHLKSYLDLI